MPASHTLPIRLFVIEHQPFVLFGLEKVIESSRYPMKIIGCARSCAEAHKLLQKKLFIDELVLDIDFDFESGLKEIPKFIKETRAKILVLTGAHNMLQNERLVHTGAMGVVEKESPVETLLGAIIKVNEGQLWFDRMTTGRIFVELSSKGKIVSGSKGHDKSGLTKREQEIIVCLTEHVEATIRETARMLCISEHTLHNHLTSIYDKLELTNRMELFVYAQKHGLVNPTTRNNT